MCGKKTEKTLEELIDEADEIFRDFRKRKESRSLYEKALKIAEEEERTLEIEYIQGTIDLIDEKWENAIKHFDESINLKADFSNAWKRKGVSLDSMGKYEEAITCYDKALEIDPEDAGAWYNKGVSLDSMEKHEEAIACYDKALGIDPKHVYAWNNKGVSLRNMEKHEEAITCYDKALGIDPKDAGAWYNKGVSLDSMGKHEEAIACYDKALGIDPKHVYAWNNKGVSLDSMGKYEEAIACYDKALGIDPKDVYAWNNKGVSLRNMEKYEEAITCYDKALEIDPKNVYAWNNKGISLHSMRKYEEAIACYDKALGIDPKDEVVRNNRNSALILLGKFDEAQKDREELYLEKKKQIHELPVPEEEQEEKILELDAKEEVINELRNKYKEILEAKRKYEEKITNSLKPRESPLSDNFFIVLRRWNSYTPVIPTSTESNVGGGYFLYWKGKGIVIDPGFDFVDNLFNNNLRIYDIDAVIITHAHVDHCSDFESILTLLFEYNEKNRKKKIDVFMNLGAMKKFLGWISIAKDENTLINRLYPLERGIHYDLKDYNLQLTVTKAIHNEVLTEDYSVGLIFELYNEGEYIQENPFRIGYTSDTRHDEDIENQYKDVDIIIPHLGSIDEHDFSTEERKPHPNHLMLTGVISTIYKSRAKLAIISEFGEELEEHRVTIVGALNRVFQRYNKTRCLTGDIGLNVLIPDLKVKCHYCSKRNAQEPYKDFKEILEEIDPENKSKKCVIYFCKEDKKTYDYELKKATG